MEAVFLKFVNMSITASWLVLAVITVRLVFRNTPKWMLCLLWGLVAIRLICPFSIESGLSLIPNAEPLPQNRIVQPAAQARGEIIDSGGSVVLEKNMTSEARGEIIDSSGNVVLETNMSPAADESADPIQIWSFILSRVWAAGVAIMVLYALVSYLLICRRVATAIPMAKNIKRSEFVDTPFVLGLIRPVIYLPSRMGTEDIPYVIAHEQAHIRRRDHWWKPLGFLLLSVYWFNPAMWLAYILLCRDIEAACDEKVIRDMPIDDRRAYSTALLNCSIRRRRIAACPLAFGEVGVKERVKNVMHYKKPAFWVVLTAVVLGIVMAVCFLTNPDNGLRLSAKNVTPKGLTLEWKPKSRVSNLELEDCRIEWAEDNDTWEEVPLLGTLIAEDPGETIHTSACETGWELDWTANYGILPPGEYRIRVTCRDRETQEIQTIYAPFSVEVSSCAYVWFDQDNKSGEMPREHFKTIRVPGRKGVTLTLANTFDSDWTETLTDNSTGQVLISGQNIRSAVFADLSGDGVCELYAAVEDDGSCHIQGYDWESGQQLRFQSDDSEYDTLCVQEDCLFLLKKALPEGGGFGNVACFQLGMAADGQLEALPLEQRYQALTSQITGITLWGRKVASLNQEQLVTMQKLLRDLEGHVEEATAEQLAAAKADFNVVQIYIQYTLGNRVVNISSDRALIWEEGGNVGYLLTEPEPLHSFMEQLTQGVKNRETRGTAFATAGEPWSWTSGISSHAVETARAYACLQYGQADHTQYSSSTSGIISQQTLDSLLTILNELPREAITAGGEVQGNNFMDLFYSFQEIGCSFTILDGVNDLAAGIRYVGGTIELLLTTQTEQFNDRTAEYLTDARLWVIEDENLLTFMQHFCEDPSVINYSVGAEYDWQAPLEFQYEDFSMRLRLIEGWEYETVPYSEAGHTGIRCRPAEVGEGWIYFSYWPDGYAPEETDRLVLEGFSGDGPFYTSYPSTIGTPNNFSTNGAIWSYQRTPLSNGDYAVINDGADSWFPIYTDQIEDTVIFAAASIS
ncbi:MAG: M56 family metallopeptidase [Faecousia sp.]